MSAVVEQAQYVMLYTVIAPIINSICFIWDGVYMGTSNTKPLRNTMIIATFLIYVPLYLLIAPYMGIHAISASLCAQSRELAKTFQRTGDTLTATVAITSGPS